MNILIIEDDPRIADFLGRGLRAEGHRVELASTGPQGLEAARQAAREVAAGGAPVVLILDLMLPGIGGLEICQTLRAQGAALPILMLSALGAVEDRVAGLRLGADDYLAKPFDLDELEARIRALARRAAPTLPGASAQTPTFCGLRIDAESGAICHDDRPMDLTARELALLRALLARPGQAVAKERLFELVFPGEREVQTEAIEVVVYRLRKKLAQTGVQLVTLRGLGYLLKAAPAPA